MATMADLLPDPLRQGVSQQQLIANFPDLLSVIGRLTQYPAGRWIFRGQPDARWSLQSSIERLALPDGTTKYSAERFIRREFRRRATPSSLPTSGTG
jgi:FRG domain